MQANFLIFQFYNFLILQLMKKFTILFDYNLFTIVKNYKKQTTTIFDFDNFEIASFQSCKISKKQLSKIIEILSC